MRLSGVNKALLREKATGRTLLEGQLDLFTGRFREVILVLGRGQQDWTVPHDGSDLVIAWDRLEEAGPLAGIEAGLRAVSTSLAFVCAADMPSIRGDLVDRMAGMARAGRALVPLRGGRPEPLHAIYPRECLAPLGEILEGERRSIRDLLDRISVDWLDESGWSDLGGADASFLNLNTPEDLKRAGIEMPCSPRPGDGP